MEEEVMEKAFRRRHYFIRKKFQLKYIGLILAVMLFSAIISGYTIYYNAWALLGEKLASVYPQGRLIDIFHAVNVKLLINMILVSILCAVIGLLISHRIAGPVYRMITFMDKVTGGDYSQRIKLRKNDDLKDLADAINRLIDKLESEKKSL